MMGGLQTNKFERDVRRVILFILTILVILSLIGILAMVS